MEFHEASRFSTGQQVALVDIDETICSYPDKRQYNLAQPIESHILKINKLYDEGWKIIYWTARGSVSKKDYREFTYKQLDSWGCKYHDLIVGDQKPFFDLVIDDKAKRIEEL